MRMSHDIRSSEWRILFQQCRWPELRCRRHHQVYLDIQLAALDFEVDIGFFISRTRALATRNWRCDARS